MINKNPEIDALNKQPEFSQKPFFRNKKRKSAVGVVLRIAFIYFPLSVTLALFAYPFLVPCGSYKARESEAKQYVGSMNRAQQAKFAENGEFANSVDDLELGIKTKTTNFHYLVNTTKTAAFSYGIPNKDASERVNFTVFFHWDKKAELRGYVGAIFLVTNNYTKETSSVAISCVTKSPTKTQPPNPILNKGNPTCANGTDEVTR